jgi:phosphatidylglycerol lysyltransferase
LIRLLLPSASFAAIRERVGDTPASTVWGVLALTVAAFGVLALHDRMSLRGLGLSVPMNRLAPISAIVYGIGHAIESPLLTSTPLRFRLYAALGLGGTKIVRLLSSARLASWSTLAGLAGALALLTAHHITSTTGGAWALRGTGLILLLVAAGAVSLAAAEAKPDLLRRWRLELLPLGSAAPQMLLAAAAWLLAAGAFWVALPATVEAPALAVLGVFLLAQIVALCSHVPGGIGVFEATVLALMAGTAEPTDLATALLLFRLIYTVAPLVVSLILVVVVQRSAIVRTARAVEDQAAPWLGPIVPRGMAIATFAAGTFLIVSGAIPSEAGRLNWLTAIVPLGLIEASHLLSSVAGLALLVLARGLVRRLDGAWHATVWILALGLLTSLLGGFDWEEATVAALVLILLIASRRHFYRRASITSRPFSNRWLLGVGVVLAGSLWLGLIASGNTEISQEQLWRFSLRGDVPRFLRAQVALATGVLVLGLWRMFRGAAPPPATPSADERQLVQRMVQPAPTITANFALLGDKRFLWSDARDGFVMYGVSGDSWISLGDPVVPSRNVETVGELIWRFREQSDLYDERSVFYQIRPDHLPLYLEAGLSVIKIGENARASLEGFSLAGSARRDLRQSLNRGEREGLQFEMVPREAVPSLLPELRTISDEWLADKNASEKAFSLGAFHHDYIVHFPCALVRRGEEILAFANVVSAGREELSVDLMRYRDSAPYGVMDYLFCKLMLWGSSEGFRYFHLGMAPLAGLEQHALAPAWNRLGAWLFRHGEHFYNFQGLRAYKEKFSPEWEPRYIAAPDGLATSRALLDVATLIAGGLRGLLMR